MEQHKCQLDNLCRLCGCKPSKRRKQATMAKKRPSYMFMCAEFHEELLSAFHIDTQKDSPEIHPPKFCNKCYVMIDDEMCNSCITKPNTIHMSAGAI